MIYYAIIVTGIASCLIGALIGFCTKREIKDCRHAKRKPGRKSCRIMADSENFFKYDGSEQA